MANKGRAESSYTIYAWLKPLISPHLTHRKAKKHFVAFSAILERLSSAYCKCNLEFVANKVKWQRLLGNSTSPSSLTPLPSQNAGPKKKGRKPEKKAKNWQFNI